MSMHPHDTLRQGHVIESAGVDWITCTQLRARDDKKMLSVGERLLHEHEQAGNDVSEWSREGYRGLATSGVRVGSRQDTYTVSLSSEMALAHWREVFREATNTSRLDVQTTVRLLSQNKEIIRELHAQAMAHKTTNGRPAERTLIQTSTRGDTLYIGRRLSETMLRAYDKGREKRTEAAGVLVRYEAELKRGRARRIAADLYSTSSETTKAATIVSGLFVRQGVRVYRDSGEWRLDASSLSISDDARRLAWLATCVRPSVKKLVHALGRDRVLFALGLSLD